MSVFVLENTAGVLPFNSITISSASRYDSQVLNMQCFVDMKFFVEMSVWQVGDTYKCEHICGFRKYKYSTF